MARALDAFERAVEIYQRLGDQRELGRGLGGVAAVYQLLGDFEVAAQGYEQGWRPASPSAWSGVSGEAQRSRRSARATCTTTKATQRSRDE